MGCVSSGSTPSWSVLIGLAACDGHSPHPSGSQADLEALRVFTLRQVLTEERRRYAALMAGLLDSFKVEAAYGAKMAPYVSKCIVAVVS